MYTDEKTTQVVIALLKAYEIKNIVISPGTRNSGFAASVQNDPFFNVFSVIDERSAAYFATGLAFEQNSPVVITCTGATASRNYLSALTEAYYRNLPIIALTCAHETGNSFNYTPQHLDRTVSQNDVKVLSISLPKVVDDKSKYTCELMLNVALNKCISGSRGPVHIDLQYLGVKFDCPQLPSVNKTDFYSTCDLLKDGLAQELINDLSAKKVGIFIGQHPIMSAQLQSTISKVAKLLNAPVFVDHTSNYYGDNKILVGQICDICLTENKPEVIIDIGSISGQYSISRLFAQTEVWRVSNLGEIRQRAGFVKKYFDCEEEFFFDKISNVQFVETLPYYEEIEKEVSALNVNNLPMSGEGALPFSAAFVSSIYLKKIPANSSLHVSILNSLRCINFFNIKNEVKVICNVGGFGIDGPVSTLIGQSCSNRDKLFFGQIGDLACLYDMNVLANRHISNNVRILVVNNGQGVEFRINTWLNKELGKDQIEPFISARGHSPSFKAWAESCGFEYMAARNKKEFLTNINSFCNPKVSRFDKPVFFEVFVHPFDDVSSIKFLRGKPKNKK